MNCAEMEELLSPYCDNELPPELRAAAEEHLRSCPQCTKMLSVVLTLRDWTEQLPQPTPPPGLWETLERRLEMPRRAPSVLSFVKHAFGLNRLALAALLLIAVGLGITVALRTDHHAGLHGDMDFGTYVDALRVSPEHAQRVLLASHGGRPVGVNDVERQVQYRPLIANGPPPGFTLESVYLIQMPCCTCVQTICKGAENQTLVLFEHATDRPACFGQRGGVSCQCAGKRTQIVEHGDQLIVTWPVGRRAVTIVGVRDLEQLLKIVQHFEQPVL
jgi:hypothetical protein